MIIFFDNTTVFASYGPSRSQKIAQSKPQLRNNIHTYQAQAKPQFWQMPGIAEGVSLMFFEPSVHLYQRIFQTPFFSLSWLA